MKHPVTPRLGWAVIALAVGGCSSTEPAPQQPQPLTVNIGDNFFTPGDIQVAAGIAVTWEWQGANQHTVTFDNGHPGSETQSAGTFRRTFDSSGTFSYHCSIHGALVMSGKVTVGGETSTGGGEPTEVPYVR